MKQEQQIYQGNQYDEGVIAPLQILTPAPAIYTLLIMADRLHQLSNSVLNRNDIKVNEGGEKIKNKEQWFKHNGWGFKDTEFVIDSDGLVRITGNRYQFSGQKMPKFREWAETVVGLDTVNEVQPQREMQVDPPVRNQGFLKAIEGKVDEISEAPSTRVFHSHGHSLQEIYALRHGKLPRTVDLVVFIADHSQAQLLIEKAKEHKVVLIPFGGGTNVTQALLCDEAEKRTIVSVDVTRLNKIKWVDKKNMMACVEAGIIGKDLEKELSKSGMICGHEPDSVEFSSLGGWISTRASGMKKNKYGNIDDIVISIKIATPIGTFNREQQVPRVSSGPDLNQFILGHEGNFGIITECVIKVRPLPEVRVFESIIFHDFESGCQFMYDVAQSKIWPASLRVVDNKQFVFGMALKTESKGAMHEFFDKAKKYFVTQIMKFDPAKMTLCTIVFEGSKEEVSNQQNTIYRLAKKYSGFKAGPENGERGYFLTFVIGYLRDFASKYNFVAESFETSVPWKDVQKLCTNVEKRILADCKKRGVKKTPFISFRATQIYDTGAAVYVYFGFIYDGLSDPVRIYSQIEDGAREEIMKCGGSISHHHGVGKLRKKFLKSSIGETGVNILKGMKEKIDPDNIFATGNLV